MESIFERKFLEIYTAFKKTYAREIKDWPFLEQNPFKFWKSVE